MIMIQHSYVFNNRDPSDCKWAESCRDKAFNVI